MAKLYKVMTRYDQIMQWYTSYGQIWQVQSYSQIWAIYTKICSEVAMLCKITAKIGQVIQSSGQFIQIYVQIWLAKMVKLNKDKDFFSVQPVVINTVSFWYPFQCLILFQTASFQCTIFFRVATFGCTTSPKILRFSLIWGVKRPRIGIKNLSLNSQKWALLHMKI